MEGENCNCAIRLNLFNFPYSISREHQILDAATRADFDEAVDMSLMLSADNDRTSRRRNALSERSAVERLMVHKTVDYLFKSRENSERVL